MSEKILIGIDCDERYPDFSVEEFDSEGMYSPRVIEIDENLLERVNKAIKEYSEVQSILSDLFDKSKERSKG